MTENLDYLLEDDINNTCNTVFIKDRKIVPLNLKCVEGTNFSTTAQPVYSIVCPKCGAHNNIDNELDIWPRSVNANNNLSSCGDKIGIEFECEKCETLYELTLKKRHGLGIFLEQVGYKLRK